MISSPIAPSGPTGSWVIGDPDYSKLGQSTKLANLEAYSNYEEGVLTPEHGRGQLGEPGRLFGPAQGHCRQPLPDQERDYPRRPAAAAQISPISFSRRA